MPLIEKCGSLIFGNDQEKLKKLLILSIAPLTILVAPSNILLNLSLIAPSTLAAIFFAPSKPPDIVD